MSRMRKRCHAAIRQWSEKAAISRTAAVPRADALADTTTTNTYFSRVMDASEEGSEPDSLLASSFLLARGREGHA